MSMHICQRCGACCAAFRVAFHWSEAQPAKADGVPEALAQPLRHHELAMRGTDDGGAIRCVALEGVVGERVACTIYAQRPTPCRAVRASWEDGTPDAHCDRARARHGLRPLAPDDWL
jgi:Fe-S-cluster containining protein